MKRCNRVKVILVGCLMLFLCGWGDLNKVFAVDSAIITLQPPSQDVGFGAEFDVVVNLDSQALTRGYQLEIFFDSSKFEYVSHSNLGIFPAGIILSNFYNTSCNSCEW